MRKAVNRAHLAGVILLSALALPPGVAAQERGDADSCPPGAPAGSRPYVRGEPQASDSERAAPPDVLLDVPHLTVETLLVEVDTLHARLSLDGNVATLVRINAGVEVQAKDVRVLLCGVDAEAHLRVRLDTIARIITRALQTLDKNPALLRELGGAPANRASGGGAPRLPSDPPPA